jgi:hypothetical protein
VQSPTRGSEDELLESELSELLDSEFSKLELLDVTELSELKLLLGSGLLELLKIELKLSELKLTLELSEFELSLEKEELLLCLGLQHFGAQVRRDEGVVDGHAEPQGTKFPLLQRTTQAGHSSAQSTVIFPPKQGLVPPGQSANA